MGHRGLETHRVREPISRTVAMEPGANALERDDPLRRRDPLMPRTAIALATCALACVPRSESVPNASQPEVTAPAKPTITTPPQTTAGTPGGPIVGELGTAHPTIVQAVPPTGHWIAICQARTDTDGDKKIEVQLGRHGDAHGDELRPFLLRAAGAGEALDAFVGGDSTGRHVAVVKKSRVTLLDTWAGTEHEIAGADASDDPNPYGPHRAVSFDAGRHAAWTELADGGASRIVVRNLDDGTEQRVDAGPAPLWRFDLDASGRWLWIWTIDRDTDKNGTREIPRAKTSLSDRACRGPVDVYGSYGWQGDEPTLMLARVRDGAVAKAEPGALGVLAGGVVVRRADKALVRRDDDGEKIIVPAECAGRIVHADEPSKSLWVACMAKARPDRHGFQKAPLHRFGLDGHDDLRLTVQIDEHDEWDAGDPLLYTLEDKYVNVATGTVGKAISGPPYMFWDDRVLYIGDDGPFVYELATGKRRKLAVKMEGGGSHAEQGPLVALVADDTRSIVFDFAKETSLGHVKGKPIALATSGQVLVSADGNDRGVLQGPLRWVAPE